MDCMFRYLIFVFTIIGVKCIVELKNNGYEGLYIVIDDNVDENEHLIDRIKTIFTSASDKLFTATKNRAYFRNITIVIPQKWKRKPDYEAISGLSTLEQEHIVIHSPCDTSVIQAPYVRQYGPCSKPGLYMNIDPRLLLKNETEYGSWDQMIVHNWAHLRWGVFDENIMPANISLSNRYFYQSSRGNRGWLPIKCTKRIRGDSLLNCDAHRPCDLNPKSMLDYACRFCPSSNQQSKASLMYSYAIPSIDSFCDKGDHETDAPSMQNIWCQMKSVWEVMESHVDFRKGANRPVTEGSKRPTTFRLVQSGHHVRVFVLDTSGSMVGTRINHLYMSGKFIIENLLHDNSYLGIITFSYTAQITAGITQISGSSVRERLKNSLPYNARGGTSIGAGLTEALRLLQRFILPLENAEIILISDGEENIRPFINETLPDIVQSGVVVHTIAVSQDADMKLKDIAVKTGGRYLTYLETPSITFLDVFSQTVMSGTMAPNAGNPLVIYSYSFNGSIQGNPSGNFKIDTWIGYNTKLTVITSNNAYIYLNISGPKLNWFQRVNSFYSIDIPGNGKVAEEGEYVFTINQSPETSTNIFVSSFPKPNETNVVRVSTWFSDTAIDCTVREDIILYASVDKCRSPVLNVKVWALLQSGNDETKIVLNDRGTGPDIIMNDGIYSAYILKRYITINGRHNMKVFVEGVVDVDYNLPEFSHSARRRSPASQNTGSLFTRVSIPNEIIVTNFTTHSGDTTPPDRIRDFRITNILGENIYIIKWTATGDDRDQGQARLYDMRSSDDIDVIRYNFSTAVPVENVTFSPHQSGELEEIALYGIVDQGNQSETSYLAIRAIDDSGNIGDVSNIISVVRTRSFRRIDMNTSNYHSTMTLSISEDQTAISRSTFLHSNSNEQTTIVSTKTTHDENSDNAEEKKSGTSNILIIVLPSVALGICVIIAILVSLHLLKALKKQQRAGYGNTLVFDNTVWPSKDRFQPLSITHEQRPESRAWESRSPPPPYIH
ncbi:hypothetical protein ACJMK2_018458 [Sinanodonta woodiana]|uniref:VWFA domain-containing protein n=1 Tax=Sinanodonta woodiana TaxID=1069815 RepID=A0ABD3UG87_SINWO